MKSIVVKSIMTWKKKRQTKSFTWKIITTNSEDEKGDESAFQKPIDDEALKARAFSFSLEPLQVDLIF